jgi:hypothetical protein
VSRFPGRYIGKNLISLGPQIRPANSGQNPTRSRILYFHTRYLNRNIFSFRYQNQNIQSPKFICTSRNTTSMKDSNSYKIVLKAKLRTQSGGRNGFPTMIRKPTVLSILIRPRVWHKNGGPQDPRKMQIKPLTYHEWMNIAGIVEYCKKPSQKQSLSCSRVGITT